MLIQLEPESDVPIFKQLVNGIIEGIARGGMAPGDPLPSVRNLAADLGVNMHTVNKSYRELEKKGMIKIVPKSGAVLLPAAASPEQFKRLAGEFKPLIAEALVTGMNEHQIQELMTDILKDLKGE